MASPLYLADTSALLGVTNCIPPDRLADFFEDITPLVGDTFGFPIAVKDDLIVVARDERITGWAQGVADKLRSFTPATPARRWVVRKVQLELGYENGFQSLDGKDPASLYVAALARQMTAVNKPVIIVTEDVGRRGPLSPRMSQMCDAFEWQYVSMKECLISIGLSYLIAT